VKVYVGTEDVIRKIDAMKARWPVTYTKMMREFLMAAASYLATKSKQIAGAEAKGSTSQYFQAFNISPITTETSGTMSIEVANQMLYSLVVEYGGKWSKQPPVMALDHWVRRIIAPGDEKAVKSMCFAIANAILNRSKAAKLGQVFKHSAVAGGGKVMTMNRAFDASKSILDQELERVVDKAIKGLWAF